MKHYTLYDPIASGGMGTVHYARGSSSLGLSRVVAAKRLRGDLARDPRCLAMFRDELRLATRVRHPNVVGTLDMVEQDGELLLIMDLVQGESLQELIARSINAGQRVPPAIAVSIVCGILQGLEAAHDATSENGEPLSIVHRDVSPENILVGHDGIARLLDFGIARGAGRKYVTHIGEIKGKPSYLAPEQILDSQNVDRRADIYGASIVLWEALTGQRLFEGDTPHATLSRVLTGQVPRPSSIVGSLPEGLDDAVMRGLSRNADDRYATALEMARALRRVCGTLLPFEVGEWVQKTATESLAQQAATITRLESLPPEPEPFPRIITPVSPVSDPALLGLRDAEEAPESTAMGVAMSLRPPAVSARRDPFGLGRVSLALRATGLAGACFLAGLLLVRAATSQTASAPQPVAVAPSTAQASNAAPPTMAAAQPEAVSEPVAKPAAPRAPVSSVAASSSPKKKKPQAIASAKAAPANAYKSRSIIDDGF
ncbi:MAG TPA: serine/threonine-protein kinase [Polyangiaceae bacterium]|nr:serine/threonine-protein kinase [Polyangiaceae bacterium]